MSRTIIVGDIHGCWDELQDLFGVLGLSDDDVLVSVGDLVDRGPDPASVVGFFRHRPNTVALCGNHERKHVRGLFSPSQTITRIQFGAGYAAAVEWMGTLPYYWESNEVRVVHAAAIPGVPLAETPQDILSGTTLGLQRLQQRIGDQPWYELYEDALPLVFGHSVFPTPWVRPGRAYGIDTGVCHGQRLTALVIPSFELVSVPGRADHWRSTRRRYEVAVLASQPWHTMSFEQVSRKVRELSRGAGTQGRAWLADVLAWSEAVRAWIPGWALVLDTRVRSLTERVGEDQFAKAAAADPVGTWLIRRKAGKLSDTSLGCDGPGRAAALAGLLGVPAPTFPASDVSVSGTS